MQRDAPRRRSSRRGGGRSCRLPGKAPCERPWSARPRECWPRPGFSKPARQPACTCSRAARCARPRRRPRARQGDRILRSVGAAAGAGAAIDGGWALVHAVRSVRRGSMTQREAVVHVVREATTGAAATAAGASAAVLLVALTGGVAAPAAWQTRSRASQSSSLRRPSSVHPGGASLRRWVRWRYFADPSFSTSRRMAKNQAGKIHAHRCSHTTGKRLATRCTIC